MTKITPKLLHAIGGSKMSEEEMLEALKPKEDLSAETPSDSPRRRGRHNRRDMRAMS